jgi:hypothetical protein
MIRVAVELIVLFLVPTLAYLGYVLLVRPRQPVGEVVASAPLVWLGLLGTVLVLGTLVYYGVTTDTTQGGLNQTYMPARIKDGQIEPGHFK